MARHNIVLGRDAAFTGDRGYAGFRSDATPDDRQQYGYSATSAPTAQPGYGTASPQGAGQDPYAAQQSAPSQQDLEALYARPSASSHDTGRMTMGHALNAITVTLGIIIVLGLGVMLAPRVLAASTGQDLRELSIGVGMLTVIPGLIGGFILGLVNSIKKRPSAVLTLAYAVFEGLLLGGLSTLFEVAYPGIAIQAVGATFAVAGTVFVLFRTGFLRTTPKLNRIAAVAGFAYLIFLVVNIGVNLLLGIQLYDGVLGLVIGALAVGLCSYCLVGDLEEVQNGVRNGVPREYAWRCAFALAATLVWMYIEILRIISILRD